MNLNSIRWRLPASYAFIALIAAHLMGAVMMLVLQNYYARQERDYLSGNAFALQPILEDVLQSNLSGTTLQDQINALAFLSQAQIRLFDVNGNIIADSGVPAPDQVIAVSGAPDGMIMFSLPVAPPANGQSPSVIYDNDQSVTPQFIPFEKEVPVGQVGDIILPVSASPYGYGFVPHTDSDFTHRSSQVVKVSLNASDDSTLGELEFSNGPSYGANIMNSVRLAWLIASTFAILVAALTGWFISQRVTHPVLVLEQATRQMEHGNLSVRVDLPNEKQHEFLSLANSFNGMAEQVEQTVSTLRAFVADAAHELHTPLTALQANLELLRDEEHASERTRYLIRAKEQGQRLEALVKNLLDLSRIEATESRSSFTLVDVSQILHEIAEQFASRAEQANRNFEADLPDAKIEILGDEKQLRQVFTNLLENAIKFTSDYDTIKLSAKPLDNLVEIEVMDTGVGIPPDDLPNLFKRFHRGRNVSEIAGNGLGLAIVKAIVEVVHGGRVKVKSEGIGMGSSFIVILPI